VNICVIGLGKIGLPLAVQFAKMKNNVIGADINELTVATINQGLEPFPQEENLQMYLAEVIERGNLKAVTDNVEAVSVSEVVIVVVPLFVDENANPDFSAMDSVSRDIAAGLQPGTLISYETTLPIGTTRSRFLKILEEESGLKVGVDFYLVFSPERVLTGRVFADLKKYPKIVGGVTTACTQKGVEFYESVLDFDVRNDLVKPNGVWRMNSSEEAEFVKLAETTYRDVNIGLANQFAIFAAEMNLDVYKVINAANSQPYSHIHTPGISVGGHCIPIYPQFYLWNDPKASVVRAAREVNASMPSRALELIESKVGSVEGLNVAILGIAYRPKVKETAFSGSLNLLELLNTVGANVYGLDPLYSSVELASLGFKEIKNLKEMDVIILHTAHEEFREIDFSSFSRIKIILDGRNFYGINDFPGELQIIKI
jgi:UDP-N-acetyl-D-glucosamine dehydrogenase